MRLLVHICCANCAVYPMKILKDRGIELLGLWFNPNIHPVTEYNERLSSVKMLQKELSLDFTFIDEYGLVDFLRNTVFYERNRCQYCYSTRLEKTAKMARELSMDAFTTSLLISPYQDFSLINELANTMALRYNVEFFIEDFRPYFYEGKRLARDMGFYQQKYCGCIYSEMERYGRS